LNTFLKKMSSVAGERPVLFSLLLISLVLVVFYSNSFTTDWHYDDFHHIKENINIRKLSNIPMFFTDASTFSRNPQTRMYRPLLMSTHALNYWLGIKTTRDGYNEVGYHVVNFLFHLISTLAIFYITLFLFRRKIIIEGLNPLLPAIFCSLLFGLQTINTETIVYVSSRSSVMATMFVLMAFYLFVKATDGPHVRWLAIAFSVFLYFSGMMSKEIAITLPAMLLLYEVLLNRDSTLGLFSSRFLRKQFLLLLPYGAAGLFYIAMRGSVMGDNLVQRLVSKGGTQAASSLSSQLATQSRVFIYYLREWLWPTSLSIDKPFPVSKSFAEPKVVVSLVIIAAIIAFAIAVRKRYPAVTFGTFWFIITLLPTSLFRLNVVINDHRLYMPGFGAALIFTYVAAKLYIRFRTDGKMYFKGFVTICLAVLLLMGLGTFKRNMAFATEETMWKDVILKDRKSVRGYNNLGIWYEQNKQFDKALTHYQQTIKLAPMFPNPYINIGNVYHKKKNFEKAESWMKRAIQLDPRSALAYYNLGNILREAGKTDQAIGAYNKALQFNPRYIEAANNMANIYFKKRDFQKAIQYYKRALFIDPTFAMSYYNTALSYERLQDWTRAAENYRRFINFWIGEERYTQRASGNLRRIENILKQSPSPGS